MSDNYIIYVKKYDLQKTIKFGSWDIINDLMQTSMVKYLLLLT